MKKIISIMLCVGMLLSFAACGGNGAENGQQTADNTAAPTEAPTPAPTEAPTPEPVVNLSNTPIHIRKATFMDPGALSVSVNVLKWIADEGYDVNAKYDVVCEVCFCSGAGEYKYNGKTLEEYRNDPVLAAFNEEYKAWFIETFVKDFAEAYPLAKNGDEAASAIVFDDIYQRFYEEWSEKQAEETIRAYNEAYANYNAACESYLKDGLQDASGEGREEEFAAELARLASLGYEFEPFGDTHGGSYAFLHGSLTIEQIWSFSADVNWAYYLTPYSDQYAFDE